MPRSTFSERFTSFLIRWRWLLLALSLVAVGAAIPFSAQVTFDRSIENMFAPNDPLLAPYQRLKRTFGGNEIVMAVYRDPQLLNEGKAGIRRLQSVREKLEQVPGVRAVLSIDVPLGEAIVEREPLGEAMLQLFENYTHSRDGQVAVLVCMLEGEEEAGVARQVTIDQLRHQIENLPDNLAPGLLAGEPVMVSDGFSYVQEDGRRLGFWSLLLLAAVIAVCFRSLRWVLIPLAVVQCTLLLTRAVLVGSGLRLSMVSSMLTAIVTVVGTAAVVHVILRYREGRDAGLEPKAALQRAGTYLVVPTFWSCATDAIGFLSLVASDVGPVRDFGVMTAIGSIMVMVAIAGLVPALALGGRVGRGPLSTWGEDRLGRGLSQLIETVHRRPRQISFWTVMLSLLAIFGLFRLRIETDFTKNFRPGSPIVRSYEFIEQELGGAGVLDVILPAPPSLTWEYLRDVQRLEERLRRDVVITDETGQTVPGLTKVLSLSDAIWKGSPVDLAAVPGFLRGGLVGAALSRMQTQMPAFYDALYGTDPLTKQPYFRIMLRARERQSAEAKLQVIEQVERIVQQALPATETRPPCEVAGFYVLLTNLIASLLRDQWVTFGLAAAGILVMIAVALRNPLYAVAALIPNALPILLVLGAMGWLGIRINMGAAMIAAVSLGLSVDSSIHYLTAYQRLRREGQSPLIALHMVQQSVGRAVVFATLALVVGFTTLCTSEFVPTIYFGALVSLAMLGGLAGNLVILPLLLSFAQTPSRDTTAASTAGTP